MKPLDLGEAFRRRVRDYPKETRAKIGQVSQLVETDFGHPRRHRGLGIRKLTGDFFEIRVGPDIRLVFQNRAECLLFVMAGNYDETKKFLRGN